MADQYKWMAKIFFILQLLVAWSIVVLSTLYASWDGRKECGSGDGEVRPWWVVSDRFTIDALGVTVFVLTIVAPFLISFESYINAKARQPFNLTRSPQHLTWRGVRTTCAGRPHAPNATSRVLRSPLQARWRQLRSCAGALKSITWAYRTRVAPSYALHPNAADDQAERTLRDALIHWREEVSARADLNTTTLRKRFPEWVFKHGQRPPKADSCLQRWAKRFFQRWFGTKSCWRSAVPSHPQTRDRFIEPVMEPKVDDYYSPVNPEDYIELRFKPAIAFYQMRVPEKTRQRMAFKLSLLTATVASSFLARYQLTHMVTTVTAFASMIIAYSEFADADRKVER